MFFSVPVPKNENVLSYAPGSSERDNLVRAIADLSKEIIEIPSIINGKEVFTGSTAYCIEPHNHQNKLAIYHKAGKKEIDLAIQSALAAHKEWENMRQI